MTELFAAYSFGALAALTGGGVLIGLLAGLLGVGGGIVAVPLLIEVFAAMGMPAAQALSLAIGTAQANMLIASLVAASAHWRAGTVDLDLVRSWLPGLAIGAVGGLWLGPHAPAGVLIALFATVAAALALTMTFDGRSALMSRPPTGAWRHPPAALVGALAAALGIGCGTLSTPVLSLFAFPVRRAIGAGSLFNLVVALPATVISALSGRGLPGRPPDAIGDVALFCVAALSLPALIVAPMAARWSARAPLPILRRLFALCLAAIALRLIIKL